MINCYKCLEARRLERQLRVQEEEIARLKAEIGEMNKLAKTEWMLKAVDGPMPSQEWKRGFK